MTSSVFAGISVELRGGGDDARLQPVLGGRAKVVLPLALPGLAAAAIFVFIISWNEVFAASMLTLRQRTLPAQILRAC